MVKAQRTTIEKFKEYYENNSEYVKSWDQFHNILSNMRNSEWIFRGVSSPEHYLIPSIGWTHHKTVGYNLEREKRLFREFKKKAISIFHDTRLSDWDWLAYAQHVGVPTRLLDWSESPLIAAFFALEKETDTDRVIYCVKYSQFIHEVDTETLKSSPFDSKEIKRFSPPLLFDRIRAQRGVFTIHPNPKEAFFKPTMKIIKIAAEDVRVFRNTLFKYGIVYWSIYPDAHGLAQQLKWQIVNGIGLGAVKTNGSIEDID